MIFESLHLNDNHRNNNCLLLQCEIYNSGEIIVNTYSSWNYNQLPYKNKFAGVWKIKTLKK